MLSHAYIDLSGAYKDTKKELSAFVHAHRSRVELLKDLITQLENQVHGAAGSVVDYEEELESLRSQNAGLVRQVQALERAKYALSSRCDVKRQLAAVTGTPVCAVPPKEYDVMEDVHTSNAVIHKEELDAKNTREKAKWDARDEHRAKNPKRDPPSVKHSSQVWKPAKPNYDAERKAAAVRDHVRSAGDDITEEILAMLGE